MNGCKPCSNWQNNEQDRVDRFMNKQLFIRTSSEYLEEWNKDRIVNALIRETYIDRRTAEIISDEVEKQIIGLNVSILTSALIRELVGAKLIELGLEKAHKMHTRLGVPMYDVDQMILHHGKDSDSLPLGPELTNLALANRIKREYALLNVFSQEVADAHLRGDIYLEGLEFIDRLYSCGQSVEYLKKFGLTLSENSIKARPAKHPDSLVSQLVGFTEVLRGHFFHSVEWDAVNTLFAPYTAGVSNAELKQLVQTLVFELSRQSVSLGGMTLLNLYWHVPDDLSEVAVLGARTTSKAKRGTYQEYQMEAQRVLLMVLEVLHEGDAEGNPFPLPIPLIHISETFFKTPGYADFLGKLAEFILKQGHTMIIFERNKTRHIYRSFSIPHKVPQRPNEQWHTRHAVINSVTINLPRVGYIAQGSDLHLFARLTEMLEVAAEAHMQKRVFIEKLLATGRKGPLGILMMKQDNKSFLQLEQADFLVGLAGLNELVQIHKGAQLHESEDTARFGIEIVSHLNSVCERLSQRHHISFVLGGTPNRAISSRLARLDLRYYSPESGYVVKGNLGNGNVYYTDSTFMNPQERYPLLKRMNFEGRLSGYLPGGSMSYIATADYFSHKKELAEFLTAVFRDTQNSHIYFSSPSTANPFVFMK
jgi:ribonucleoside-triphosphate reductase (formate)